MITPNDIIDAFNAIAGQLITAGLFFMVGSLALTAIFAMLSARRR